MQIGVKKIQFESGANFADPRGHTGLKSKRGAYGSTWGTEYLGLPQTRNMKRSNNSLIFPILGDAGQKEGCSFERMRSHIGAQLNIETTC